METSIVVALISLVGTIAAVLISNSQTREKIMLELDKHNAVQDERIRMLTDKVEKHNSIMERTFRLEQKVEDLEKEVERHD